ncbi:MAG TPA: fibronectin type III domain-containing protein [Bryobacteraceae bacterium]|nr:fibronectin type III domain-containing protein [Bryobacteraceae bacterium]
MIDFSWRSHGTAGKCAGAAILLLLVTAGCGYIGQPLVPLANVPQRIPDLAAVQRGASLVVHCTIPTLTTENNPIEKAVRLELRVGVAANPFVPGDWATGAQEVSPFESQNGMATFHVPVQEWIGKRVAIGIRSIASNGKASDWSNFESLPVVAPPQTPSKPTVQDTAAGEKIGWTGEGERFRVLRKAGDENGFTVATTVAVHEWTDTAIDYGKTYSYEVQSLVDEGSSQTAESEISPPTAVTPKDTFAPAVPAGLHADRAATGVSLVWEPDSEPDLGGYRIYRSEGSGAWQKLADVSAVPTYSDSGLEHGKIYHYAVSAFDKTGNESERSAPVEVVFP